MYITCAVMLGFALDAVFGDPKRLPHPVCAVGKLISLTEKLLRRLFPPQKGPLIFAGVLLWIIVCGASFVVPFFVIRWLSRLNFWARFCGADCALLADFRTKKPRRGRTSRLPRRQGIGRGGPPRGRVVCRPRYRRAERGGRHQGGGRNDCREPDRRRGVAVIYMLIGWRHTRKLYKAVNTLDSMVGYHNEKYEYLGKFSAKMDDIFNFIPARLSALCIIAGAGMLRLDNRNALRIYRRDRNLHKSPNAGQTESACAGALHIQLGGDASYFGKTVKKAAFGDLMRRVNRTDILATIDLMNAASVLALVLCCAVRMTLWR